MVVTIRFESFVDLDYLNINLCFEFVWLLWVDSVIAILVLGGGSYFVVLRFSLTLLVLFVLDLR